MLWLTVRVLHQPSSKGTSPQPMPSLQDPERASGQGRHKLNSAGCKWARGPFRSSLPKYADRESTALLCSSVSIYNDVEKWLHVTCTLHSSISWYYDIVDDVCVCEALFNHATTILRRHKKTNFYVNTGIMYVSFESIPIDVTIRKHVWHAWPRRLLES